MKHLPVLYLCFALAAPAAFGEDSGEKTKDPEEMLSGYGFSGYPGLKHFAGEVIRTSVGECLIWEGFWSADPPEKLIEHYSQAFGVEVLEREKGGAMWRFPPDQPARVLDVRAVAAPGIHGSHRSEIPPEAQTVVIASRMSRLPAP